MSSLPNTMFLLKGIAVKDIFFVHGANKKKHCFIHAAKCFDTNLIH
jgi:hypothetical protein